MRSRTETEMATGTLKVSSVKSPSGISRPRLLNILLRKLPGKVLGKFQIFSDTTADYAGFRKAKNKESNRRTRSFPLSHCPAIHTPRALTAMEAT
jgi:hypothetical protein